MTEKEKEKTQVVEKRIKPSVIRRRPAKAVAKPEEEAGAEKKKKAVAAPPPEAPMPESPVSAAAQAPAAAPEPPAVEAKKKPEEKKPAVVKKGRVIRGKADEKKEAPAKKTRKVREKSPADLLAELKLEEAEEKAIPDETAAELADELAVEKAPEVKASAEATAPAEATAASEAGVAKKEVKVFEKDAELKKFFTSRKPARRGRHAAKDHGKARGTQARPLKKTEITVPKAEKRVIKIVDAISVSDLSQRLGVKAGDIIKKLMSLGVMATINQLVDIDAVTLVAQEYGYEVESAGVQEDALIEAEAAEAGGELKPRPPVVTVMGHVDHGKTSLLDAIRETNVVSGEAGGITQHIGAHHVHLDKGDVTFLDTPGHEAFTAMRARGAKVTDIVILVVAADDGVMPQTIEAINHAKAANVPIIVAINKIDLPQADPNRIKQELTGYGLVPEEWGGENIFIEVSAKKGIKIKELLELILLQAEVLELKANPSAPARGVIVEAKLDKGRGPVSTVLIHSGTLNVGDAVVTGQYYGRIRAMINDWGKRVDSAAPSMPVEVLGLAGVPQAGDTFAVVKDEATAKQIATIRQRKATEQERLKTAKVSLTDLYDRISKGEVKELNLVIKADVHGSIEAIKETLAKLSTDAIKIKVIHSAVGGINEGDVMLAAASNAIIVGFNVRPDPKAQAIAEKESVDVRLYAVIYNLVDEVRAAMEGMLAPVVKEETLGRAEIREVFRITKVGNIAGCFVTEGKIVRGAKVRLIRDNVVIYDGKLSSLKRFKDDVKEVATGYECGMSIEGYNDIKAGDVIEAYALREEAAKL